MYCIHTTQLHVNGVILKGQQTYQAGGVDKDQCSQFVALENCNISPTYKMHQSNEKLLFILSP